jgi:hypothetical protein
MQILSPKTCIFPFVSTIHGRFSISPSKKGPGDVFSGTGATPVSPSSFISPAFYAGFFVLRRLLVGMFCPLPTDFIRRPFYPFGLAG